MQKLNLQQGDSLSISETPDGVLLTPYDEKKAHQLDLARKIMRENRNMLKKLAE